MPTKYFTIYYIPTFIIHAPTFPTLTDNSYFLNSRKHSVKDFGPILMKYLNFEVVLIPFFTPIHRTQTAKLQGLFLEVNIVTAHSYC